MLGHHHTCSSPILPGPIFQCEAAGPHCSTTGTRNTKTVAGNLGNYPSPDTAICCHPALCRQLQCLDATLWPHSRPMPHCATLWPPFSTDPGRMSLCFGQLGSRGTFKQTQQQVQLATSRTGLQKKTFQLSQPSQ